MEEEELIYCPIIAVTAYVSTESVQKCYDSGMNEVGMQNQILYFIS